jgi:hypothetical protein
MSHVDEGLIHAYLDGAFPPGSAQGEEIEAHLAVCVDCSVLLEKARAVKERAHMVMNRLAPTAIDAPAFEEILARRARGRAAAVGEGAVGAGASAVGAAAAADDVSAARARRRRMLPPLPLAWAATLVLAVGAGWMVRAYLGPEQFGAADEAATFGADAATRAEAEATTLQDEARLRIPPATPVELGAAESSARAPQATAGEARDVAQERRVADAAPPPAAAQKAAAQADAGRPLAAAPVPEAPSLLGRSQAAFAPLAESVDADGALPEAQLLAAYGRATTEGGWQAEAVAGTMPLLGYREIARLDGGDVVRAERATIDATELLRIVYRVDGDTVELVQRLEAVPVALEEVVVTGGIADTAAANRPPPTASRVRTDSLARLRAAAGAAAGVAADVRLEQGVAARTIQTMRLDPDGPPSVRGRNLVLIAEGGRQAVLMGTLDEARLQRLATDVRR